MQSPLTAGLARHRLAVTYQASLWLMEFRKNTAPPSDFMKNSRCWPTLQAADTRHVYEADSMCFHSHSQASIAAEPCFRRSEAQCPSSPAQHAGDHHGLECNNDTGKQPHFASKVVGWGHVGTSGVRTESRLREGQDSSTEKTGLGGGGALGGRRGNIESRRAAKVAHAVTAPTQTNQTHPTYTAITSSNRGNLYIKLIAVELPGLGA
jgi:hypothetical protein